MTETLENIFPSESPQSLLDFQPYFSHLENDEIFGPFEESIEALTPSPIFRDTEFPDLSVLDYDILQSPGLSPKLSPNSPVKSSLPDSPKPFEDVKKKNSKPQASKKPRIEKEPVSCKIQVDDKYKKRLEANKKISAGFT